MKLSERWLREWVDPPVSTEALAEQLTMAGLEVDSVEPAAGAFDGVVVGHVLDVMPHPDADKLRVCQVDVGAAEHLQIVCGAPNVHEGMRAPTAVVGAALPGPLRIEKAKLRGVESRGMLCSASELGLGEKADGLMALPAAAEVGQDLRAYLRLDDTVIDVDLTPNRGDCLGVAGVAREVGVINGCDVTPVEDAAVPPEVDDEFPVVLEAPADCPRYLGRVVRGVDPRAPTPMWMVERLRRSGVRSLGPLVDVTNYVMLELGQPMHAFDLERLSGGIVVRRAGDGETLTLLDGTELKLDPELLLIADHDGPLALAGIMGGEGSGCDADTRDVFLESAFFSPLAVLGKARRFGLHTDASHRFERGVDPLLQRAGMERATRLLVDIAGGKAGPIVEAVSEQHLPPRPAIRLRSSRIERLLGLAFADANVTDILSRLGMTLDGGSGEWTVSPPSFRFDVAMEADLIEEIGRIYGYDKLPSAKPLARLVMSDRPETRVPADRVRDLLVDRGYQEAVTYSFVDPTVQAVLDPEHTAIPLANPLASDLAVMRTSLLPGLIGALRHNLARQQSRVRLFETGLVFYRDDGGETVQLSHLGAVLFGDALPEQWGTASRGVDFFDAKGDLEAILGLTGRESDFDFRAARHPALHPGRCAQVLDKGQGVGWIGALHPRAEKALDLGGPVYVFEMILASLTDARIPAFKEASRFPSIRRDIAIVVDEGISAESVRNCVAHAGGEWVRQVAHFDVYTGKGIDPGRKSLAIGLILQADSRTLTDSEVETVVQGVVARLEGELGATLRK